MFILDCLPIFFGGSVITYVFLLAYVSALIYNIFKGVN